MDKEDIICILPNLEHDESFHTIQMSPEDPDYNCIAWAYQMLKNRWMEPNSGIEQELDAVYWWPDDAEEGYSPDCLKDVFVKGGFVECESWEHEDGYIKVALYEKDGEWTHASRECLTKRSWMSKLGEHNDIYHDNPCSVEGKEYGKAFCFLKKKV
jgi:hypothetical protein